MDPSYVPRPDARNLDEYMAALASAATEQRAADARSRQLESLDELHSATRAVQEATLAVHGEVERMASETAKAQKLALWVGAGIALAGAVIGGFAGAVAARIIGG